jgi:hypothetical protein
LAADEETLAAVLRITGGDFRLLDRLLTQVSRVLEINSCSRSLLASSKRRGKAWSLALSKAPGQKMGGFFLLPPSITVGRATSREPKPCPTGSSTT